MGSLVKFPRITKYRWSAMEREQIEQAVDRAITAAKFLQATLESLPKKERLLRLKRLQSIEVDDDYLPWGGIFKRRQS